MAASRRYVEALDFVRAVTVVSMIAVHSTWYMANGAHWILSGAILALMHFTRESFMALTGFVLTYTLFGKPIQWVPILWKRYRLVLFPYVIWTAAYMLLFTHFPSVRVFAVAFGRNLLDGNGWFHLYYLLITMQFYLLLPAFLRLMRLAKQRPLGVMLAALSFELALTTYDQYGIGMHPRGIDRYISEEVWTYSAYFVLGGIGALYWPVLRQWLRDHLTVIITVAVGTAIFMLVGFGLQSASDTSLVRADSVIQPAMVPWAIAVIMLLAALGVRYEDSRRNRHGDWSAIKWAADLSFGLYLVHPLLLQYWTIFLAWRHWDRPSYWLDGVTIALLVVGSGLFTRLISWTPVSPWIIGRAALPPGVGKLSWLARRKHLLMVAQRSPVRRPRKGGR